MNRDTNMNTKWFGKGVDKSEKEKIGNAEIIGVDNTKLKGIYNVVDKARDRKKALQDDNSTANKLNLTTDELAELGIKEKDLEQIIKELSSLDENGDPKGVINVPDETDINSSGSEEAMSPTQVWEAFAEKYISGTASGYEKSLEALAEQGIKDNLYVLKHDNQTYHINEGTGAERIAYELVHQLAKLVDEDLNSTGTKRNVKVANSASMPVGKVTHPTTVSSDNKTLTTITEEVRASEPDQMYRTTIVKDRSLKSLKAFLTKARDSGEIDGNSLYKNTLESDALINSIEPKLYEIAEYNRALTRRKPQLNEKGDAAISNWGVEYSEFAENDRNFNFKTLDDLIRKLCPSNDDSAVQFIDSKFGAKWPKGQKFGIKTVRIASPEEKANLIEKEHLPQFYNEKGIDVYWNFDNKGEVIEVKGLLGWIKLYNNLFNDPRNNQKFTAAQTYIKNYDAMCAQLIYQRLKDDLKYEVVGDKDKNHYIFTITSKLTGKKTKVAVNYNVGRTIAALSSRLESLRSNKKSLTDGQLTEQSGERNKHNDKIAAEDKTIEGQDKEYDKLLKEKAKEKQVALEVLKKKLNAADVVWEKHETILEAAKAENYLLQIAWVQSGGVNGAKDVKEDKESEGGIGITAEQAKGNNDLLYKIEQERIKSGSIWHSVIINHFKNQGVDNESRIKKIIEECSKGGVSLEAVMNAFDFMGGDENKKIAKEIKDAIGKVKIASDSKDLSEADLNEVLGITDATPDMVTKWSSFGGDGWGKDKNNIKDLFDEYNKDGTKSKSLIEYAEGLNNDKFKSVKDAADDSAKFIAFKKTDDVEIIVRTVLEHKNKAALDNTDKAKRDEIVTRMKVTANTGYDQDHSKNVFKRERYGNPEEPEKLTKDQISNFLLDEKTKNITKQNESWSAKKDEGEKTGVWNHIKSNWHWYALGGSGIAVVSILLCWKSISEWWNGPSEDEGEKGQGEDEE